MLQYIILGAYISLIIIGVILLNYFQKSFICRKVIHISIFGLWLLLINFIWPIWFIIFIGLLGLSAGIVYYILTKRFSIIACAFYYGLFVFLYPFVSPIMINRFTVTLAILSVSDGFAGLLGTLIPSDRISTRNDRTYFGSFIMLLSSVVIFLVFNVFWPITLAIAAILTIIEYCSPSEWDNYILACFSFLFASLVIA